MAAAAERNETPIKAEEDDATELTAILHDLSSAPTTTLSKPQLSLVAGVLSPLYSVNRRGSERCRALAFLVLSRISTDQKLALQTVTTLSAYINAQLQETSIPHLLKGISLLDAIVQVDTSPSSGDAAAGSIAKRVLEADGLMESITDVLDTQLFTVEDNEEEMPKEKEKGRPQVDIEEQHSLLDYSLAHLFSSLANIPAYRSFLGDRPRTWLEQHLPSSSTRPETKTSTTEDRTRVLAAVTLTKLARATIVDPALNGKNPEVAGSEEQNQEDVVTRAGDELEQLTAMLKSVVIGSSAIPASGSTDSTEAITSALEGLAYTSSQPELKAALGNDDQFIRSLVGIAKSLSSQPQANASKLSASYNVDLSNQTTSAARGNQAAAYGIATIMYNLFARKPVHTEEQRQVEALKRMANAGAATGTRKTMGQAAEQTSKVEDKNMSDEAVHARVQRGIKNGAVEAIAALAKADSLRVKQVLGSTLLALVHEREDRLEIVKQGGYKALKAIIATLLEPPSPKEPKSAELEKESLPALQALAKLVITTPPSQLFGAGGPGGALDAVRPVALLLLHADNSMLQRFEAMMALTNLASVDPTVAQRIYTFSRRGAGVKPAKTDGQEAATTSDQIVQAVENQMLEDHKLVRRAAVELVCNLMISDESFARYSGDYIPGSNPSITTPEQAKKASTSRLHILLALTDVRDLPTRLAASGALAMLTQSETACSILLGLGGDSTKAWEKIGGLLAPLKAEHDASGEDNAFEEEEDEEVEEISTLPPDEGLVHRGLTIALNLFHHIEKLPPSDRAKAFKTADSRGVTRHLINLLAIWTDKNLLVAKKVKSPPREVLDLGIECLRILKANDIQLVV